MKTTLPAGTVLPFLLLPALSACLCLCLLPLAAPADSTISTADNERFAYGANTGWVNFRWDTGSPGDGAVVTDFFLSGYVYAANCGWIDLGDGMPVNGIQYQNTVVSTQNDFGVNHDGLGNLSGFAYGANIGWVNFGWATLVNTDRPRIVLATGKMTGYAYSANTGWIDLGKNSTVVVRTSSVSITDTDADGISDAWELQRVADAGLTTGTVAGDLAILTATGNHDADGDPDVQEFLADNDPFDPLSNLRITDFTITPAPATTNLYIEWSSRPTRIYDLGVSTTNLGTGDFTDVVGSTNITGIDPTTSQSLADPLPRNKFWKVEAKLPLSP